MVAHLAEAKEDFKQIAIIILWFRTNPDLVMLHSLKNTLGFRSGIN